MVNWFKEFWRREKWPVLTALAVGVLLTAAYSASHWARETQAGIAGGVLRLHVRANSDTAADQALKLNVRDAVLAKAGELLKNAKSAEESRLILVNNMGEIEAAAAGAAGEYAVFAYLTRDAFPTKTYGGAALPAGEYDALRVDVGAAGGQNWWCVLFPPLCVTDGIATLTDEGAAKLKAALTDEQYALVTGGGAKVRVKFKALELFDRLKNGG